MFAEKSYTAKVGKDEVVFSVGKLAQQANASVLARLGGTEVLATVVISLEPREDVGYFPLMVDYEEKLYAAGKIKGSRFIKQEGRPTDEAVLSARLVDRAIRPLFPKWLKNDVQVILTVLSFDKENDADMVALNAAVAALTISEIPWAGPIAGLRVSHLAGQWLANPSYETREKSLLNLVVAGTADKTLMIEADANEASEAIVFAGVKFCQSYFGGILEVIEKMKHEIGKEKLAEPAAAAVEPDTSNVDYKKETERFISERVGGALITGSHETKAGRKQAVGKLLAGLEEHLLALQIGKDKRRAASALAGDLVERAVSDAIIKEDKRVDGRKLDEIRPLSAEVGLLARTHGSGLFNRGETQVLSVVTLDAPGAEMILDTLEENDTKRRYFHHYYFPPYSVGEAKPLRGPGRRETGHGALAEKALLPMLPSKDDFPYTIRVVSEVLSSNGSSSMGSACGSTLALLDAGVPIKKAVAGIAMGLASDEAGNYKILTDLQDLEDGPGGMDFKVAGTRDGITAIQVDTKTKGLANEIVEKTLAQALGARLEILDVMEAVIKEPKALSQYAPRITTMRISPDKIRTVIGSGGKTINEIIANTGVEIDIDDDGLVMITSTNAEGAKMAQEWIERLTHEFEPGQKFEGKVVRIMDFGAFVELLPGHDGLVHISKLAAGHVNRVEDVVNVGDTLAVEVEEIDEMGRLNLKVQGVEKLPRRDDDGGGDRPRRPFNRGGRDSRPRR